MIYNIPSLKMIKWKLKYLRINHGIRKVSKIIGVSPATISRIENGKPPSIESYFKICKWLNKKSK